jgi:hypothetical protein
MRIVSKFKDFYDFASPYRDSDRRSYYWERHTHEDSIELKTIPKDFSENQWHRGTYLGIPRFRSSNGYGGKRYGFHEEFVVVADKIVSFWMDVDEKHDRIVNPGVVRKDGPLYSTLPDFKHKEWTTWINYGKDEKVNSHPEVGDVTEFKLIGELQVKFRAPVLHLSTSREYLQISINPNLTHYGIQHVLDGTQVYQDIEMWFANQEYEREHSIPLTDKQKIVSHGLDLKTSFRHPIK